MIIGARLTIDKAAAAAAAAAGVLLRFCCLQGGSLFPFAPSSRHLPLHCQHAVVDEVKAPPAFPKELEETLDEIIAPPAIPVELVGTVERSRKFSALLRLVSAKFFTLPIAAFDPSSETEKG